MPKHFHVSAKSADNVEQLFKAAAQVGVPSAAERLTETLANSVCFCCSEIQISRAFSQCQISCHLAANAVRPNRKNVAPEFVLSSQIKSLTCFTHTHINTAYRFFQINLSICRFKKLCFFTEYHNIK